jgi:long-chain fatty acid transport protein
MIVRLTLPALLLVFFTPAALHASAIRIGFKDAEATARGNAFAATADSPAAVYYNPAGLTQIDGQEISATAFVIQLQSDFTSPLGARTDLKREFKPVPQLFYAVSPEGRPWAFGLGAYAPFGLSTEWPGTSDFATLATKSELTTYAVSAQFAYEITPTLSFGAGPVIHRAEGDLRRNFTPVNEYFFEGSGEALGFSAGLRWQPSTRHAFGLSYQHHHHIKLKGTTGIAGLLPAQNASAGFQFPEVIIAGYSFRPAPGWNLEINVDWTNWDRVNRLAINTAAPLASTMPFNWQSGFYYDAGVTRTFDNGLSLSAGYTLAENSIPDSTYNPAIPDADRHILSLGLGYKYQRVTLQLNYQYAYSENRIVQGSPASPPGAFPAGQTADGTYKNRYHAISTSLSYEF